MTYLPELRDSLVKAAERAAHGGAKPRPARLTFGGVATALAAVTAVAVAAIALIAFRHGSSGAPSGGSSTAGHEHAARQAATQLLGQVVLPTGAVKTGLRRGIPAELWKPSDFLQTPHRVDVYGVWRLTQSPEQVIRFLESHRPPGSKLGSGEEGGFGSAPAAVSGRAQGPGGGRARGGGITIDSASTTFNFPGSASAVIWRELAVQVVAVSGGGSVLRADAQAGWLDPRPAAERIPAGIQRVQVTTVDARRGHLKRRTSSVTEARRIGRLVSLLNGLPSAQGARVSCGGSPVRIRYSFSSGSSSPAAVAVYDASCNRVELVVGGRRWPDLRLGLPDGDLPGSIAQLRELASFAPPLPVSPAAVHHPPAGKCQVAGGCHKNVP